LLRQSLFGCLAGYEDVNDADRLRYDPGAGLARLRQARWAALRRLWLATETNLSALTDLFGQWIADFFGLKAPFAHEHLTSSRPTD
jgi:hypothetical protein